MKYLKLKTIILLFILVQNSLLIYAKGEKVSSEKPNIIFILADDLGFADLGYTGSDLYETPNIDRLASQSMYFTDAYSSHPTCQPSRLSIQTGKYPARMGCVSHAALGGVTGGPVELPKEEVTIGEALQLAGYTTCHIGKWHIGIENQPFNRGYDYDIGSNDFCCPATYFYPYSDPKHRQNKLAAVPDLDDRTEEDFLTEALTQEAVKFIGQHKDKPFFINMSYHAVHTPIQAEKDKVDKYKGLVSKEKVHNNAIYAGLVEHLDDGVGRIMKALEDNCLTENTIVIFASDNGGETGMGITTNFPFKEGKGSLFEGGYRIPFFVKWPGVTKPGSKSSERVIGCDYYPTILHMAGTKGVASHNKNLDGVDLTPLLQNPAAKLKNRELHWLRYLSLIHYKPSNLTEKKRPSRSIIKDDWKLIEFYDLPTKEGYVRLYNLKVDSGEQNDLSASMPGKVEKLKKAMTKWEKSVDAPKYDMEKFYGNLGKKN